MRESFRLGRAALLWVFPFPMLAWATHPLPPLNLKQAQVCAMPPCPQVPAGGFVAGTQVQLTASSDPATFDSTTPNYKLQFEVRLLSQAFTGTPTHESSLMAKPSGVLKEYPYTAVTLSPGQYKWQVREAVLYGSWSYGTWVQFNGGNHAFTIGNPNTPELTVEAVRLSNMVSDTNSLTFTVSPTFRNFGLQAANNFYWRAYLSTNRTYEATDQLVYTSTTPFSVGPNTTATTSGNVAIAPKPQANQYYVIVQADHTNAVAENDETNNYGATLDYFTSGIDLVATSISGPALSGPDSTINVNVRYFNQGSDAAGVMTYKVYLSANTTLDGSDFVLHTDTKNMTGGQTVDENLSITVPRTVPGGTFYYLLEVDSGRTINEANESNNVVASTSRVVMQQADLELQAVELVDGQTHTPVRVAYLGQPARLVVTMKNVGGADAKNFKVGVVISADTNLSLLSDTVVHDEPVALVQSGQTRVAAFDVQLPLKDRFNRTYQTGQYYLFALLDSFNEVGELSETNNNGAVGHPSPQPVTLLAPNQDYTVTSLSTPANAAVGEVAHVVRTIKNIGNVAGSAVAYRYFASVNALITTHDIPLRIVGSNGALSESGTVALPVGGEDARTEVLELPATMPPGTYYIGCIVDPDDRVAELDEQNNAVAAPASTQVAASPLRIATTQLPDGTVGWPYFVKLAAEGEQAPSIWALAPDGGALPDGLSLAADGTLSGTPAVATLSAFTVVLKSGNRSAAARLVLRVLPPTTQLEITTASLPPIINSPGVPYQASLGASGGVKPYSFRLAEGALPSGITFSPEGVFSGSVRPGTPPGESLATFEVADSVGNRARASMKIRLVQPGALVIQSLAIPDSLLGADYLVDLAAQNADNTPLNKPLVWSVASGSLPDGLTLRTDSGERGIIQGKPTRAGTFAFAIQVEDAKGRFDVADFLLRVFPYRQRLTAVNAPKELHPGDEVRFTITTATPGSEAKYYLHSGRLPPGLLLLEDGTVSGTVEAAPSSIGVYNFAVEARDASGGGGLGAFALEVLEPPAPGCASASGLLGPVLLLLPLVRRRRQ